MRWYQCDSAADLDPKIRSIIRQFRQVGERMARDFDCPKLGPLVENAGVGALWRTWNFVARHGTLKPGWSLDSAGRPYQVRDMAENCGFTPAMFERLINLCVRVGHVDQEQWHEHRVIVFPAMARRADDYTKKKARNQGSTYEAASADLRLMAGDQPPTYQDRRSQTKKPRKRSDHREAMIRPDLFDLCWDVYPRKVAKQEAMKAWNQLNPDEELVRARIQPAIVEHSRLPRWREAKDKIPHFATWVRGKRWEDDVRDEMFIPVSLSRPDARFPSKAGGPGATGAPQAGKSDAYASLQRRAR